MCHNILRAAAICWPQASRLSVDLKQGVWAGQGGAKLSSLGQSHQSTVTVKKKLFFQSKQGLLQLCFFSTLTYFGAAPIYCSLCDLSLSATVMEVLPIWNWRHFVFDDHTSAFWPLAVTLLSSVPGQDAQGQNYLICCYQWAAANASNGINADYRLLLYKQDSPPHASVYRKFTAAKVCNGHYLLKVCKFGLNGKVVK